MSGQGADIANKLRAVDTAMRAGNTAQAIRLAGEAAKLGADRVQILVLAVFDCLDRGETQTALEYASRARAQNRHDPEVLNAYALALDGCGRDKEALAAFDAALRQAPGRASLHYNKGNVLDKLGHNNQAHRCFERAVALQPSYPQALGRLAHLAVERGDFTAARSYGERALKILPGEQTAILALAAVELEEKKFETVLARVKPLADGNSMDINHAIARGISGDALDGLEHQREAFRAYTRCNETMRTLYRETYEQPGRESARGFAERLAAYFKAASAQSWRARKTGKTERTHVFLVGFPRSGTTLLEQVLATHPDVESMDERICLGDAAAEFLGCKDDLDRLAGLSDDALEPWREAYWARVAEQDITPTKKFFVDKLPLTTIVLPLVAKLFPDSKILFALRDPMDVVWSCFRRRFGMNAQMYAFLDLKGAARYYDAVMGLAENYRAKLGLDMRDTVYERTVADFENEIGKTCTFLNLEWNEAMADFAASSRKRSPNTPSGPQVAHGLYSHAVGQWTAYREQLEPVLPILAPWRARFGYSQE